MTAPGHPPRIPPLEPPYHGEIATQLERWMPGGWDPESDVEPLALFRTLARHEQLMSRMRPLGAGILGPRSTVPPRLRELMIDRTCALTDAEYEWGVHAAAFGAAVGLDDRQLDATAREADADDRWTGEEAAVLALAEELHATSAVSDRLWEELRSVFDDVQIIELLVTAGWYHAIAYVCNGLRIPLEPWARRFPS